MKSWFTQRTVITGMAAMAIASTAVLATSGDSAFAQGDVDAEGNAAENRRVEMREVDFDEDRGGYISDDELLANALGLTEAEVEEAYQKAFELSLDQAVADGELTQAQADELKGDEHGVYRFDVADDELAQYLAQAIDMSQAEFDAALDGAIQKAADDGLITQAQANDMLLEKLIEEKVEAAYKEAIDVGVDQGLITQSQADQMKEEPFGGMGHDEEIIFTEPFAHGQGFGPFGFEFGPGDFGMGEMFEDCIAIRGPMGMMHEECFDHGGVDNLDDFHPEFHGDSDDSLFWDGLRSFGRGWFRMP